jgi:hypothetical protein
LDGGDWVGIGLRRDWVGIGGRLGGDWGDWVGIGWGRLGRDWADWVGDWEGVLCHTWLHSQCVLCRGDVIVMKGPLSSLGEGLSSGERLSS